MSKWSHKKWCILCVSYLHCKISCASCRLGKATYILISFWHVPWNTPYTHLWKVVSLTLIGSLKDGFCFWKTLSLFQQQKSLPCHSFWRVFMVTLMQMHYWWAGWTGYISNWKENEESKVENWECAQVQGQAVCEGSLLNVFHCSGLAYVIGEDQNQMN